MFIIVTYGASWGYALSDVKYQLSKNIDVIIQEFRIRMPGNYILEYGAYPYFYQKIILKKATKKIEHIVNFILNNKPTKSIAPNLLARLYKKNGDGKLEVFNNLGTKFYNKDNCHYCGICIKNCPAKNIEISNGTITWGNKCQQCVACIQWCPYNAIAHPALKDNRKRYTHPDVSLQQLWR